MLKIPKFIDRYKFVDLRIEKSNAKKKKKKFIYIKNRIKKERF